MSILQKHKRRQSRNERKKSNERLSTDSQVIREMDTEAWLW